MSLLDRQVIAIAALIFLLSIIPLLLSLRRDKAHYRNALRSAFNIGPYKGPPIPNTRSSLYALWVVTLEFAAFSMISIYQSIKIIKGGAFNEPLIYNIFTALFLLVGFLPGGLVMFLIIRIIKIMRRH